MLAARIPPIPWVNISLFDSREQLYACFHQLQFSSKWKTVKVEFTGLCCIFHVTSVEARCTVPSIVCAEGVGKPIKEESDNWANCLHILPYCWHTVGLLLWQCSGFMVGTHQTNSVHLTEIFFLFGKLDNQFLFPNAITGRVSQNGPRIVG